jgi:hypothetical protein
MTPEIIINWVITGVYCVYFLLGITLILGAIYGFARLILPNDKESDDG